MNDIWASVPRDAQWYVTEAIVEAQDMGKGIALGYPLGFKTFDHFFRLKNGQFTVIAGRPAMGKTSFALQIAFNMAMQLSASEDDAGKVVFFSAEMSGVELFHKLASQLSGVNLQSGYAGKWTAADSEAFENTLLSLTNLPLMVNDLNIIKTEEIKGNLIDMAESGTPPRAIFFDYIELAADEDARQESQRIAQVAQRLKNIAATLKIPVIGLSQVNRAVDNESSKIPYLINLAGSDTVARMADKVMTMMRPGYYLRNGQSAACELATDISDTCYISIQKDRFGRAGQTFRMKLNEQTFQFSDFEPPREPSRFVNDLSSKKPSEFGG